MKKILGILAVVFASSQLFAQFTNFNTQKNWSMNKKEFVFGVGATQFLGDLGGQNGIGRDYSLRDLDFRGAVGKGAKGGLGALNFNIMIGYRFRFHPNFATSSLFNIGMYRASDYFTEDPGRNGRQIDIKSTLATFVQRIEYIVFANEKVGKRNNIPGLKGLSDKNTQFYIFTGLGAAYYEPRSGAGGNGGKIAVVDQAQIEGIKLRPLNTEGQGKLGGYGKKYGPVTAVIPFGFGYRFGIGRMWRVSIEATYFKTFTDYMDDVSTQYYDYYANQPGGVNPNSIIFSNPAESPDGPWVKTVDGDKRGDKQKDAFFFFNAGFSKNLTYKSYDRGKQIKWRGVRAKF